MSMRSTIGKSGGGGERWREEVSCRGQEVEGGGGRGKKGIGGRMVTKEQTHQKLAYGSHRDA